MAGRVITRGRSFTRTPPSTRRQTEWIGSTDITAPTALAAQANTLDQSFSEAQFDFFTPCTIIRTVGFLAMKGDQEAADEDQLLGIGMAVVGEQARVTGVAAVPTPITEEFSDLFFMYETLANGIIVVSQTGTNSNPWAVVRFDSRGQRKVATGQALVVTLENAFSTGLEFILKFRMLLKLH